MKKNQLYLTCFLIFTLLIGNNLFSQAQDSPKGSVFVETDGSSYITGEQVWVNIRVTNAVSGKLMNAGHILYAALLDDAGVATIQVRLNSENGMASGYIPLPSSLVSGIYLVTLLTGDAEISAPYKPVLIVNPNKPPVRPKDTVVDYSTISKTTNANLVVQPDNKQFEKRKKISIDVDAGETGSSLLSMTIRRRDSVENFADSLLSAVQITARQPGSAALASWEGMMIRARVYPSNGTNPAPNVRVFVSVTGTEARVAETVSDVNGDVQFLLPLLYADAQLVFTPLHTDNNQYRIEFNPDPLEKVEGIKLPPLVIPNYLAGPIRNRMIDAQAQSSFRPEEKTALAVINPDTTDFYGKPDKRYMLDDYTRFPNMEEIITEFVVEIRIRKSKDGVELQALNSPYKKFFEQPALVLIDGVPVTDVKQLLELDPLKLQSIDIVTHKYFIGKTSYPGVIHYKSYLGNLGGYTLPTDAAVYSFEGAQLPKDYITPDYTKPGDLHIPDFRNLLYWAPVMVTDNKGKKRVELYGGDLEGSYKITVNGISSSGKPLNGTASIDIK